MFIFLELVIVFNDFSLLLHEINNIYIYFVTGFIS